jgi:hypothetical protein
MVTSPFPFCSFFEEDDSLSLFKKNRGKRSSQKEMTMETPRMKNPTDYKVIEEHAALTKLLLLHSSLVIHPPSFPLYFLTSFVIHNLISDPKSTIIWICNSEQYLTQAHRHHCLFLKSFSPIPPLLVTLSLVPSVISQLSLFQINPAMRPKVIFISSQALEIGFTQLSSLFSICTNLIFAQISSLISSPEARKLISTCISRVESQCKNTLHTQVYSSSPPNEVKTLFETANEFSLSRIFCAKMPEYANSVANISDIVFPISRKNSVTSSLLKQIQMVGNAFLQSILSLKPSLNPSLKLPQSFSQISISNVTSMFHAFCKHLNSPEVNNSESQNDLKEAHSLVFSFMVLVIMFQLLKEQGIHAAYKFLNFTLTTESYSSTLNTSVLNRFVFDFEKALKDYSKSKMNMSYIHPKLYLASIPLLHSMVDEKGNAKILFVTSTAGCVADISEYLAYQLDTFEAYCLCGVDPSEILDGEDIRAVGLNVNTRESSVRVGELMQDQKKPVVIVVPSWMLGHALFQHNLEFISFVLFYEQPSEEIPDFILEKIAKRTIGYSVMTCSIEGQSNPDQVMEEWIEAFQKIDGEKYSVSMQSKRVEMDMELIGKFLGYDLAGFQRINYRG